MREERTSSEKVRVKGREGTKSQQAQATAPLTPKDRWCDVDRGRERDNGEQ
jgi:hypothetical protein